MQTNLLKRIHPNKKRMLVARGGKRGKTSGRGGKGQTARAGNKRRPEWRDIIKKLPKLRGRGKNSNKSVKTYNQYPIGVNLSLIEASFKAGEHVTPATLIERGVIATWSGRTPRVKVLGTGEITKALTFTACAVSASARAAIERAGGTIALVIKAENDKAKAETREASRDQAAKAAAKKAEPAKAEAKKPEAKKPAKPAKAVPAKGESQKAAEAQKASKPAK